MTKENQEVILYKEEEATALKLYRNDGLDPFIENIRKVAKEFEADVTTEKGRKAYKSLAYKISQAKTKVEEIRKSENEEHQAAITANNKKGKKAVADLQAIQDEVKKPVTEWENRIAEHQASIANIEKLAAVAAYEWESMPVDQMQKLVTDISNEKREWHEFSFKAENVKKQTIESIEATIAKRKKHDDDKAELLRLQKAEEERKQKERDEAIAREAEERAKKEAEERELKLKQEKERIENEKLEAEAKAKRAETARIAAEAQAKEDAKVAEANRIAAEKQAEINKQEAIKEAARAERLRVEKEAKAKADELAKRKADEEHKKKIILEAENALVHIEGFSQRLSSSVIRAIIEGKIPHVTFNY
jgi:hypothetical protein